MSSLWKSRLKTLAERQGIRTVEKLAEATGYDPTSMSRVFTGRAALTDEFARRVAAALKVDPWEIKPDYQGLSPEEREIVHLLRRVKPERMRRQIARGIREMLRASLDSDAA